MNNELNNIKKVDKELNKNKDLIIFKIIKNE